MNVGRAKWLAAVVAVVAVTFGHLLGPFDLLTFLHAGGQVLHGHSPYPSVTSPVFRSGHGFVYPLFVAWMFAPLAVFPRHVAEILYAVASVGAIVVSCRMLGRRDFTAAALVLVCSTTIVSLQMGTVNAFLLLGLAAAWYWRGSHPALSGVALGLAAAAKLFLLPVLIWPVLRRRYTTAAAAAGTVAALIGAGGVLGSESPTRYLHLLSQLQADEQVSSWSLSSLFQSLSLPRTAASAAAVAVVAVCLALLWRRRTRVAEGPLLGAVVVCSLLMSPIVWSSYLLLLTVPLVLLSRDDEVLAVAAVASWVIVTPDAASWGRVAVGAGTALIVSYLVSRPRLGALLPALRPTPRLGALLPWLRRNPRRWATVTAAVAALATAVWLLPDQVRSPLPALAAMGVIMTCCASDAGPEGELPAASSAQPASTAAA